MVILPRCDCIFHAPMQRLPSLRCAMHRSRSPLVLRRHMEETFPSCVGRVVGCWKRNVPVVSPRTCWGWCGCFAPLYWARTDPRSYLRGGKGPSDVSRTLSRGERCIRLLPLPPEADGRVRLKSDPIRSRGRGSEGERSTRSPGVDRRRHGL